MRLFIHECVKQSITFRSAETRFRARLRKKERGQSEPREDDKNNRFHCSSPPRAQLTSSIIALNSFLGK
jgi:hypothetical protein